MLSTIVEKLEILSSLYFHCFFGHFWLYLMDSEIDSRFHGNDEINNYMDFKLQAKFKPMGDQPEAIKKLTQGLKKEWPRQTLLGVTGSGKTFTMANVVADLKRPTLVISHNKTLAAQLANEFQQFFPNNAVHYFVSYYDYYQPEAYVPQTDTYIEKSTLINEEIDRLRHAATTSLLTRRDVLIVASVSCIYGLGSPAEYYKTRVSLKVGATIKMRQLLLKLIGLSYQRNDIDFWRGTFRVRGDILDIFQASSSIEAVRVHFLGDTIEKITHFEALTGKTIRAVNEAEIFPATHYIAAPETFNQSLKQIKKDLDREVAELNAKKHILEAARLKQRVTFDLAMMKETGFCSGIENYSRYFDQRKIGAPPYTLIDFFPKDFLLFIDESHMTLPQIRGMSAGDRSRKQTLVDYGFRLQAALDNRPLTYEEFEERTGQTVYVSATPTEYDIQHSNQVVEQIIRPTGLLDPVVKIQPSAGAIDDALKRIKETVARGQRILVTTLTKREAEQLTDYLAEAGVKVQYLHSDVDTMDRLEILRALRTGKYDVIVGINLLREGLDLPEVSLILIFNADTEGFLRGSTALIQTIGRAARHVEGLVIMYADKITNSMRIAISETERRRKIQIAYNKKHHITPTSIVKDIGEARLAGGQIAATGLILPDGTTLSPEQKKDLIKELTEKMELASANLDFEKAIAFRDTIKNLLGPAKSKPRRR